MRLVFAATILLCAVVVSEKVRFDGHQVIALFPSSEKQIKAIYELSDEFDVWKYPKFVNDYADVLVPPEKKLIFLEFIKKHKIRSKVKNGNIQTLIDEEDLKVRKIFSVMDWTNYHRLSEIYDWLDELAKNFSNVKVIIGGRSYEGRQLKGIEITFGRNLPGVFIEAGIHAREWASTASTTWMINEILQSPKDSVVRKFNYLYFPVFNPDGYEYSWTTNRLWRKTRTPYYGAFNRSCPGADPNRNWDFHWNEVGTSNNPCSDIYAGPRPFSEIEMKTISDYIKSVRESKKLDIYIAYHTYGQMLLYPWGYKSGSAPNKSIWEKMGKAAADAYKTVHKNTLKYGQSCGVLYATSGSSDDWFYSNYNATVSFTIEMRDTGRYGFLLPANQIIPNAEEFYAAFKAVLTEYLKLRSSKKFKI